MKTLSLTIGVLAIIAASGGLLWHSRAQSLPARMSPEDQYHGQAVEAKFQTFQAQVNAAAAPLIKERDDLRQKVCAAAKIPVAKCNPNFEQGLVDEIKPAPAAKTVEPAKPNGK